ncbi:MAG: response regulator [Chloroflexi bacterium]|nr:MAG: hypothetical protein B6I35_02340 [Anaerolineaceae bacterium 4572_32.2]RLC81758.1 MAG: response regulator [Chloroflexota bacterium]RLC87483.1 MAG: response regulator [Chloroflexota bacterium]HEY74465.1 response regulator [Thermoflexia bacterium]
MFETSTKGTILVIEDSPTQAMHLQTMLEQAGLNALVACDGELGLQMAEQLQPDVIVLDVQMPGMNGFQVCKRLKGIPDTANIPIILLTRHDDDETIVLGLQMGAVDYIPKDAFADAVLIETLRQMGLITPEE